ncbi:MAG: hypothetical protein GY792_36720 [Gammaproteobacteria bacterium]|nr:hypothetical protein [Gammaproteobacteria bacterium]
MRREKGWRNIRSHQRWHAYWRRLTIASPSMVGSKKPLRETDYLWAGEFIIIT